MHQLLVPYFTSFLLFIFQNQMTLHQTKICAFCSIYLRVILLFSPSSLLCLQAVAITGTAPTNETDRLALLKFKEFITHDPYKILSSWNGSMHFCNWHRITCGCRHQRVTGLGCLICIFKQ